MHASKKEGSAFLFRSVRCKRHSIAYAISADEIHGALSVRNAYAFYVLHACKCIRKNLDHRLFKQVGFAFSRFSVSACLASASIGMLACDFHLFLGQVPRLSNSAVCVAVIVNQRDGFFTRAFQRAHVMENQFFIQ